MNNSPSSTVDVEVGNTKSVKYGGVVSDCSDRVISKSVALHDIIKAKTEVYVS